MHTRPFLLGAVLAGAACARTPHGNGGPRPPGVLLARAVAQAGGAAALARARALVWDGEATVHAGGRTIRIAGTWAVQPPDTAVVTTYDVTRGPGTARSLVVAAPRGWVVAGAQFTPMPAGMLANERDEFYLYDVLRLVPLQSQAVTLVRTAPDTLGQPGVLARQAGRPDVVLYMDGRGRLAHVRLDVADAATGARVPQDVWLSGVIEAEGVRWPREIRLAQHGAPYFDLTVHALRVLPRLADSLLTGPR